MKKKIVFLLTLLLTLTLAGTALANTEDQMKDMVQTYLDENGQDYVYDDYVFTLKLAIRKRTGVCRRSNLYLRRYAVGYCRCPCSGERGKL